MKTISLKSSLHRWEAIHVKAQNTSFVFFQIFCSLKYLLCAQQKEASFYLTGCLRSLTSGFLYMAELNFSCSQCPAYFFLMQMSLSKLQMNIWSKVSSFLFLFWFDKEISILSLAQRPVWQKKNTDAVPPCPVQGSPISFLALLVFWFAHVLIKKIVYLFEIQD